MLDFSFTVLRMGGRLGSAAIHSNSERGIPAIAADFTLPAEAPRLLIVGASTRAAAWSAVRAGYAPVCCDLFADDDLRQVAEVIQPVRYPDSLAADLQPHAARAWMFTGAMENHRAVLGDLMRSDRCGCYCGPPLDAVKKLRDPAWLAERLEKLACYPQVVAPGHGRRLDDRASEFSGQWLRKPLAGGGGLGIQRVSTGPASIPSAKTWYWQRYITGVPLSAVFVADGGGCRCLMVSEQLIGCPEASAPTEFTYCGSIGPLAISAEQSSQLIGLTETLLIGLNYRGLLGLDLIWDGRQLWLIEVNPRYTASCEMWDLWSGRSAVGEQLRACGMTNKNKRESGRVDHGDTAKRVLGKFIFCADREWIAPDLSRYLTARPLWSTPWIADIPAPGSRIPARSPVCTVFASAATRDECERKLKRRAKRVQTWFT